jgi:hypothetical protein
MLDDKIIEREILLKRFMSRTALFQTGKMLDIPYFRDCKSKWDIDEQKAAYEIASIISDEQLKKAFDSNKQRVYGSFRGQYYTVDQGELRVEGSWKEIQTAFARTARKCGKNCTTILKILLESSGGCTAKQLEQHLPEGADPSTILADLEKQNIIERSYTSKQSTEWVIPEEISPLIRRELGIDEGRRIEKPQVAPPSATHTPPVKTDSVEDERRSIQEMDQEFDQYLTDLFKHRLDQTVQFGKTFSISYIADYLRQLFGPLLFFDSLLSLTQQYGLADVEIVHAAGRTGMRTGWNLSLFGDPGTGKSFSVRDLVLGKSDAKVPPHGIPGRNRYAGGITPAKFIRIGQAYSERVFNFIVPEFNDWFKYKGMVEPLKLAMERGEIKYETEKETVGPYRFRGFFSVNYNVATMGKGYEVTVQDPNFSAIEDRMLCRLHRLTKERFIEIAESQMRLAFGEIDIEKGAQKTRDHLSLIYAIQTRHPLAAGRFQQKPVMLTPKMQEMLTKARKAILDEIQEESVRFSARLEDRAIRFACAASLLGYFQSDKDYIPINEEALKYALQLYVEEASMRSQEEFEPDLVLAKLL